LAIVAASFFDELLAPGSNDPAMAKPRYHYDIMLRPEPEGGSSALAPALPGSPAGARSTKLKKWPETPSPGPIACASPTILFQPTTTPSVASQDFEYSRQEIT
jgi:hypothetical protein